MTLSEYINQENPVRHPSVYLEKDEYRVIGHVPGYPSYSLIEIKGFEGIEYAKKDDIVEVYTTDSDGNPRKLSVFRILG